MIEAEDQGEECSERMVASAESGVRLDVYLQNAFPAYSRSLLQRLIRAGEVTVNGAAMRPSGMLHGGEAVRVVFPPPKDTELVAAHIEVEVLAEDDDILVVNKPAGLVVHPTRGHTDDTLVNALLYRAPETFEAMIDEERRPGIVHRLDKDTSGALVVAKTKAAWQALKAAFAERQVEKTYLAIVVGEMANKTGRINGKIGRHPVNRKKMAVLNTGGKEATTLFRVLGEGEGVSLLEVRILTGRTHQIRVHLAAQHHPVLADGLYGGRQRGLFDDAPRQMLHAWRLSVPHPATGVMREYMAPPPEDFRQVLTRAGLPDIRGGS